MAATDFRLCVRTFDTPGSCKGFSSHNQGEGGYPSLSIMQSELVRRWVPCRKADYVYHKEKRIRIPNGIRILKHYPDHNEGKGAWYAYQEVTLERI